MLSHFDITPNNAGTFVWYSVRSYYYGNESTSVWVEPPFICRTLNIRSLKIFGLESNTESLRLGANALPRGYQYKCACCRVHPCIQLWATSTPELLTIIKCLNTHIIIYTYTKCNSILRADLGMGGSVSRSMSVAISDKLYNSILSPWELLLFIPKLSIVVL